MPAASAGGPSPGMDDPMVVEVAGPAGAGKSTLVRTLLAMDPHIRLIRLPPRSKLAPRYARTAARLLPVYLRYYMRTPWFERREAKAIALLDQWQQQVDLTQTPEDGVLLFDQGPVFRLAVLSEFGPPITASPEFERLLNAWKQSWAQRLSIVVWVSARGEVLLRRIRTRPQDHAVKGWVDGPALQRIQRYSAAIERTLGEIASSSGTVVLKFDTAERAPESMAREILAAIREERDLRG